jgi:hypothetical protein
MFTVLKQNLCGHKFKYDHKAETVAMMTGNTGQGLLPATNRKPHPTIHRISQMWWGQCEKIVGRQDN